MNVSFLCLAALVLLAWVIYLKCKVQALKSENEKLKQTLKDKFERISDELNVSGSQKLSVSRSGIVTEHA